MALSALLRGFYLLVVPEIFFTKKTWWVTLSTAAGAVASVAGSFLMIPRWGAAGTAWSMVLSNAVVLGIVMIVSHGLHRSPARVVRILGLLGVGVAAAALERLVPAAGWFLGLTVDTLSVSLFVLSAMAMGVLRRDDFARLMAR